MLNRILRPLSSLYFTIVLLVMAMVLIYAGTWAQTDNSLWSVLDRYFHSFVCLIPLRYLIPIPWLPGALPMLGGYTLGALMLVNLMAAQVTRFSFSASRIGLFLTHLGLVLLLAGEGLTSGFAVESSMTIDEGRSASYSVNQRQAELAIVDPSPKDYDDVAVVPQGRLFPGAAIHHGRLPFDVQVDEFYANATIQEDPAGAKATSGQAKGLTLVPLKRTTGADGSIDAPSAYVTLTARGQPLGKYLLSVLFDGPQAVQVDGKTYLLQLRFVRYYKPYTIHLLKFSHDKYAGSDIPRNFASRVRLVDSSANVDREAVIWMNHPLYYRGETFYQSGFKNSDKTTILQVVANPAWWLPYAACAIGGLGLLIHFMFVLVKYLTAPRAVGMISGPLLPLSSCSLTPTRGRIAFPIAVIVFALLYLGAMASPRKIGGAFDMNAFASLPVNFEGRPQPLDSLARNSLRALSGKETVKTDRGTKHAIEWLVDLLTRSEQAIKYRFFRIDRPEVASLLTSERDRQYFSPAEIEAALPKLQEQFDLVDRTDPKQRDQYQRDVVTLRGKIELYMKISRWPDLLLVPPLVQGEKWRSLADTMDANQKASPQPAALSIASVLNAYQAGKSDDFNRLTRDYHQLLWQSAGPLERKLQFETFFNRFEPFIQCTVLYVLVFLLACISWMVWSKPLARAAYALLIVTLLVHTAALIGRIYMQGRPPVTNLYSSAVFIAWGAGVLAAIIERFTRLAVATVAAAAIGIGSLIVAHNLAAEGDTMPVLRAVLDTNFWLTTHVITITMGYFATFLAGFLAILYILLGLCTPVLDRHSGRTLAQCIYGVLAFALLFSFVGTVLGGIWADQSWGRFWGWDPKENGAALIVLWNAIILHARWGKLAGDRGVALLAIGGNIVTAWSWFGTNMLGVGLHSYGFMDSAMRALMVFGAVQLAIIGAGLIPMRLWCGKLAEDEVPLASLADRS